MPTIEMTAAPETAEWINSHHLEGIRLGEGGPLIRGTSLDYKPAMWRSDGVLIVVVEQALKRHRMLQFKPGRTLTLVTEAAA